MYIQNKINNMKTQKVLVVSDEYANEMQSKIDDILNEGWFIISVTAQHVSTNRVERNLLGGYLIVFER
jgi:hypothetical protein